MAEITYRLVVPYKTVEDGKAWGVILPTGEINLTVISGRAPSLVKVDEGMVKIMASETEVKQRLFVRKGFASIANDVCTIASEMIFPIEKVKLEEFKEKAENDSFYQMILEEMKTIK